MAASAFDDAGSDGPTVGEIGRVVHERQVALKVVGGFVELFAQGSCLFFLLSHEAEISNELQGLAGEDERGVTSHPIKTVGMGLTQQAIGDIPQILTGMDEIQHQAKVRELSSDTRLQGFTAIAQGNFVLNVIPLSLGHLQEQSRQSSLFAIQRGPDMLLLRFGMSWDRHWGGWGWLE